VPSVRVCSAQRGDDRLKIWYGTDGFVLVVHSDLESRRVSKLPRGENGRRAVNCRASDASPMILEATRFQVSAVARDDFRAVGSSK